MNCDSATSQYGGSDLPCADNSGLPFTGFDLLDAALVALVIIALGIAVLYATGPRKR